MLSIMKKIFTIAIFVLSMNAAAQIPQDGLIGYWPFNGNANDESGYGHNGIINGPTLIEDRFGQSNRAYYFNGVSDFINLTDSFDTLPRTIVLWFNAEDAYYSGSHGCIYQSDNPNLIFGNAGVAIKDIDNNKKLLLTISGISDTADLVINSWNNMAIAVDLSHTISYYFNGVLLGEKTFAEYITSDYGIDSTIIGANRFTTDQYFKGKIDDIRIYNRVLNQAEITSLYNENLTGFHPVTQHKSINVYPNPTNDKIAIDCGNNFSTLNGYTIKITNSLSQPFTLHL